MPEIDLNVQEWWPEASLSPIERKLLDYLYLARERPVGRDELLREVWGYAPSARTETVKATVQRVRSKIEPDPQAPIFLRTLRGRGYQLVLPRTRPSPAPTPVRSRAELEERLETWLGPKRHWVVAVPEQVHRTNLTPHLDALVGREAEIRRFQELLQEGRRLITLHGGPGIGKTRLAKELGTKLLDQFPGGVWMCDLSSAVRSSEVVSTIAVDLGIVAGSSATAGAQSERMTAVLRERPTMLILDNCEQLDDDAIQLIGHIAAQAPSLVIVATSRTRLRLPGEAVLSVPSLSLAHARSLLRSRLVALGGGVSASWTERQVQEAAELLEGLPLALVMTASRARVLAPGELLARLRSGLDILKLDQVGAPDRQRTLRAAVEWSWQLLSEEEQSVLSQIASFPGGATLQLAERVVQAGDDVLSTLASLLDKSMLKAVDQRGERRLRPFMSIRELVTPLRPREIIEARVRLVDWASDHVAPLIEAVDRDPGALSQVTMEIENLRGALDTAIELRRPDSACLLITALRESYLAQASPADLLEFVRRAKAISSLDASQRAWLCFVAAELLRSQNDLEAAAIEVTTGLRTARPRSVERAMLEALASGLYADRGDAQDAIASARSAMAIAEAVGQPRARITAYQFLTRACIIAQQFGEAVEVSGEGYASALQVGAERKALMLGGNHASCLSYIGRFDEALAVLTEVEQLAAPWRDPHLASMRRLQRANILGRLGRYREADAILRDLASSNLGYGSRSHSGAVKLTAAFSALTVQEPERAWSLLEALQHEADSLPPWLRPCVPCYRLIAAAEMDDLERATGLLAEVRAIEDPSSASEATMALAHLELARVRLGLGGVDRQGAVQAVERALAQAEGSEAWMTADVHLLKRSMARTFPG